MTSWMLARLKRETQNLLGVSNQDRLQPLTGAPTPEGYRAYLARIYGFESPVEAAFQRTPGLADVVDLRGRSALRLLRSDLQALGITDASRLPVFPAVPELTSAAEALGWMYVVEHAALLHGQVLRHLEPHLPRETAAAGSYLAGGARSVAARLAELGLALDGFARDAQTVQQIADAARLALRRQHIWFHTAQPMRDRLPDRVA